MLAVHDDGELVADHVIVLLPPAVIDVGDSDSETAGGFEVEPELTTTEAVLLFDPPAFEHSRV